MALSNDWRQRTLMLCAMYFAQGVPWGFMVTALIAYLAERGLQDTDVATLTGIVLVPWTFKLVWAPVIDTFTIRSMGRRRPWIIGAELMMAVSLLGILLLGNFDEIQFGAAAADKQAATRFVYWLGCMFFVHNCFASLQDVSTDALALDVLPANEQGRVNGLMWGSKLLGKATGTMLMAFVMVKGDAYQSGWGIPAAVFVQFCMLLAIMMFPILMLERPGEKRFPWSIGEAHGDDRTASYRSPSLLFSDLRLGFSLLTTSVFFFYGLSHVVGWGVVEVLTKPLFTQQLGWNYEDFSYVSGFAISTELVGALCGGFLADRWGRRKVMVVGFGIYGLLHLLFACNPRLWDQNWFTAGYLILNPGALAIGAVGFLSMGMRISWTASSATMFTVFMTLSNVGHVAGNFVAGALRDVQRLGLSYEASFAVAGVISILPLILLPLVNPATVDAKRADARH